MRPAFQYSEAVSSALLTVAAATTAWGLPLTALAQETTAQSVEPQERVLQEIVVTAQRREQSIQDVGISITALSGERLRELGATDSVAIAAQSPGVLFDGGTNSAFLTIRGVSQNDFSVHQESPNSVYLDEVYIAAPSAVTFAAYDIERVEVLRGPQGTLFGRNSNGGLVQYVTTKPTQELAGYADVQYGSFDEVRFEAAVGGAITDSLRARVAALYWRNDGWFENLEPGNDDSFNKDFLGGRLHLEADLGENFEALLTVTHNEDDNRAGNYHHSSGYIDANGVHRYLPAGLDGNGTGPGNDFFGYRGPSDGQKGHFLDGLSHLKKKTRGATLRIEGAVGAATLVSLSNYNELRSDYLEDCDGQVLDICYYNPVVSQDQWSQELRLFGEAGSLNWTAGVYVLGIDGDYASTFRTPLFEGTPFNFSNYNPYSQETDSYAGFAQIEYAFSDAVTLIAGARLTRDKKSFESHQYDTSSGTPVLAYAFDEPTVGGLTSMSQTEWAGKVELDYKPSSDVMFYLSVSRGIRGGGFNSVPTSAIPLEDTPFDGETVLAYELGTKVQLLDGGAYLNLATFYSDYSDYQGFDFRGLASFVSNFPAKMYGGEAEFSLRTSNGWDLSLGASVLDAKVEDFFLDGAVQGTEVDPIKAPELTFNGLLRKEWQIGSGTLAMQWDFNFVDEHYTSLSNSPATTIDSSFVHNARISYRFGENDWELYAAAKNLSDTDRMAFNYDVIADFGLIAEVFAPQRWFTAGVRKPF